jgi:hypothetical protein
MPDTIRLVDYCYIEMIEKRRKGKDSCDEQT